MGNDEQAIADYDQAIKFNLNYARAYNNRGISYNRLKLYENAIADYNRAIELDHAPLSWPYNNRGNTHFNLEQYAQALADYTEAVRLDPDYVNAYYNRGETNLKLGAYQAALSDFDRAANLDSNEWYYYQRGLAHRLLNQSDQAQADFKQAIELTQQDLAATPGDWRLHFNLALYHLVTGQAEHAEHLYTEGLTAEAPHNRLIAARDDLADFLNLFPDHTQAQAMHQRLQEHLKAQQESQ